MGLAALCVTLGLFYRASAAVFFFAFTYVIGRFFTEEWMVLVDPEVDLAAQPHSLRHASWIVPLHQPLPWRSPPHEQPDADE
jgi:hypothetical protein